MIGYKATDLNGKCRGFQFEVGKTYKKDTKKKEMKCCTDTVFHFCRELHSVWNYYDKDSSRLFEVIAGDYVRDGDKYGTNEITLIREIKGDELKGLLNSRNCNSGNCNSGDCNSGYFNTDTPLIRIFGKETELKREAINFPNWLYFNLTVWVPHDTATEEEKEEHKQEITVSGGFLKTLEYKQAFKMAYDKADDDGKIQLFKLPNFNKKIFKEISGIDVTEDFDRLMK